MKLDPCLSPHTKINSKWIKKLSVKHEILKLLKENMGGTVQDIGAEKDFLNSPPFAQE